MMPENRQVSSKPYRSDLSIAFQIMLWLIMAEEKKTCMRVFFRRDFFRRDFFRRDFFNGQHSQMKGFCDASPDLLVG